MGIPVLVRQHLYCQISSLKLKCFLSRLAVVFAQSTEARCLVENEHVIGAALTGNAPTSSEWSTTLQGSTLKLPASPEHVDLVPGHINFRGYVPDWASDFSVRACTNFLSSILKLYMACTNIGWACENFCRASQLLEPLAPWACKPNA